MAKLNYGKRFSQHGGGKYTYNETLANDMRKVAAHFNGIWKNVPKYKHELAGHKTSITRKKRKEALGHGRMEAEARMADAVRNVVATLEFHMTAMMEHKKVPGDRQYVNQLGLHNVIYTLRHKCGVSFEGESEYDHVKHYEGENPRGPNLSLAEEIAAGMTDQRAARERKYREVAERLIARRKA